MSLDINAIMMLLVRGDSSVWQIFTFAFLPLISKYLEQILKNIYNDYIKLPSISKEWSFIEYEATAITSSSKTTYDYPLTFRAISKFAFDNNLCKGTKEVTTNNIIQINKVLTDCLNLDLKNGIYVDIITSDKSGEYGGSQNKTIKMVLKTLTLTNEDLQKFSDSCVIDYIKMINEEKKSKLYHFVFKGFSKNSSFHDQSFTSTVISDFNDNHNKSFETFNHIFSEHKNKLEAGVKRLSNIKYYEENGIKRKKGYLFYGDPGCGKTYSVMAMANTGKRHVIEVPMSRVKTNDDLEKIINLTTINCIDFKRDEVIILFDEIDCCESSLRRDLEVVKAQKEEEDKLSLGSMLSRLDGIGSYNGILFVATTNCIEKLDPALYRYGRLDPIHFTFLRKEDIIGMIEQSYKTKLSEEQVANLPTFENKLAPSKLKCYIQDYEGDLDGLLKAIM